ncbi:MAG: hypothetical protein H7336_06690 [Bacteriovorax sp.]|nr:hypothetical protein [Bacteriovorax sp.]
MKYFLFLSFIFSFLFSFNASSEARKPYMVYLKPGTTLTRLSDRKEMTIAKGIYANVLETNQSRRDLFVVYNKEGKAMYETSALGILEVAQDLKILPNVDAEVVYPAPSVLKANDKIAFLDSQFNIHIDSLQTAALNPIYSQNLASAVGPRYEFRTLYNNSSLPINFGLGVNFQSIQWNNDIDEPTTLSIFSFGPQIEKVVYSADTLSASAFFGAEFSPVYQAKSGNYTEKYKAMLFDIGIEGNWSTQYGKWCIGAHFRHHDLTLSETNRPDVNPVPEEISLNSIGAMVGYKYEWDL